MSGSVMLELVGDVAAPVVRLIMPSGTVVAISDREFVRALRALVGQASHTHPGSRLAGILLPAGDN